MIGPLFWLGFSLLCGFTLGSLDPWLNSFLIYACTLVYFSSMKGNCAYEKIFKGGIAAGILFLFAVSSFIVTPMIVKSGNPWFVSLFVFFLTDTYLNFANNEAYLLIKNGILVGYSEEAKRYFPLVEEGIGKSVYLFFPNHQPCGGKSEDIATEKINLALRGIPQKFNWTLLRGNGAFLHSRILLHKIQKDGEELVKAVIS